MINTHVTSIRDFYLASFLIAAGLKLQSHNKQNGNTVFNFKNDEMTTKAINSYYSMSASIEPMTYSNAIKSLKSILYSYGYTNSNSEVNNYVKQYKGNN
jgi:hypothetical protein